MLNESVRINKMLFGKLSQLKRDVSSQSSIEKKTKKNKAYVAIFELLDK